VLLVCYQTHTLLHASPGSVVLEVVQVLHVPSQRSHPSIELRALEVGHGLNVLLPYGVLDEDITPLDTNNNPPLNVQGPITRA
jgi:hypothetical protein